MVPTAHKSYISKWSIASVPSCFWTCSEACLQKIPYAYCTMHIFDDGLELLQKIGSTGNIEISSSCAFTGCKLKLEVFSSCQV